MFVYSSLSNLRRENFSLSVLLWHYYYPFPSNPGLCRQNKFRYFTHTHTLTRFDLSITRLAFEIRYIYEFVRSFDGLFHSFVLLELILILAALVSVPPKTISFQRFSAFAKRLCVCVIPHFVISIVRVVLWRHVLLSSYPGSLLAFNNNNSSNNDNIIKPVFHWEII